MATRTVRLAILTALAASVAGGYFFFTATAQVAAPQLAQGPLNTSRTITPAFIMAVDDSGSMDFETLFPTNDGSAWWNAPSDTFIGLDRSDAAAAGVLNFNRGGGADATWKKYPYLFPFGGADTSDGRRNGSATNDHFAIPPIPAYGWTRSPDINMSYFDPLETYQPWIEADGRFLQGVAGINATTGQVDRASAPGDPKRGTTRLDLTRDFVYDGHANARFMFYGGMTIPRGTRYKSATCADGGAVNGTASDTNLDGDNFKLAAADRAIAQTGNTSRCSIAVRFFPSTFYVLETRAASVAASIGYKASAIVDDGARTPAGAALRRFEIKPGNFDSGYDAVINNFANWFSYYRKRHQAARAALSLAFADQNMKVRAGYFQINGRSNPVTMRRMSDAADRTALYNSFFGLNTNGGTPNKEAVKYMGEQFSRTYAEGTSPVQLSCQKNYGMLFTDGFSNVWDGAGLGNVDGGDAVRFPAPLADSASNTMADIAAYYYKNSLGDSFPPADGRVAVDAGCSSANPDPRLDCQTVPHMNLYGVTLGAQGLIYGSPGFEAQTRDPYANAPTWPTQFYNRHPSAVDDLWHATLNARGEFINASTSGTLVQAIRQVVAAVTAGASPSGGFALTGARIGSGSLTVEPFYEAINSTDWYGKLTARTVSANAVTGQISYTTAWEAGQELPAHADRNIHFGVNQAGVVPNVLEFSTDGLATAGISSLAPLCANDLAPTACSATNLAALDVTFSQAISYLRGDTQLEGGKLRDRSSVLGDIINSSPVVSSATDDYGYRSYGTRLPTGVSASYATYLKTKREAGKSTVYVGANDGMFHAFDGSSGEERFAYIPTTALGHLGNLLFPRDADPNAAQRFDHRYYVDGQIAVSDVYDGSRWKTIAVAAAGAGGRSVFALDVTDPDDIEVLWEINNHVADDALNAKIGYVLGKPVIVPVRASNGNIRWKAIFGNGYNSGAQQATLFVVDVVTGSAETITAAEASSSDAPGYNGLGNVLVIDRWTRAADGSRAVGRDGFADTVYAGDQNGAIWKFDLASGSVDLGGAPLFVSRDSAGNRQPIMGGLEAAAGPGTAAMIYWGTGSFSFERDAVSAGQQTFYAVVDRGVAITDGRTSMLEQTVGATEDGFRVTSANLITAAHKGWYIDLPSGERFVGHPRVESGVLFFPAYDPADADTNPCSIGGKNWLYGLNALSGGAALTNVRVGSPTGTSPGKEVGAIELDAGNAPVTDVAVMTTPRVSPLAGDASDEALDTALDARCSMVIQVAGAQALYLPRPCGRQSWRQVR